MKVDFGGLDMDDCFFPLTLGAPLYFFPMFAKNSFILAMTPVGLGESSHLPN